MKFALIMAVLSLAAFPAAGAPPSSFGSAKPTFSEEFEGTNLNESVWSDWVSSFQGRKAGFLFARDNVSVSGGSLNLVARLLRDDEKTVENLRRGFDTYATAYVRSKEKFHYGYYECRAKTMSSKVCNAFWLYDPLSDKPERKFRVGDYSEEIDIFEIFGSLRDWYGTVHCLKTPYLEGIVHAGVEVLPEKSQKVSLDFDPSADFHVYGFHWTRERLAWFIDGKEVFSRKNDRFHRPLHVTFDCEIMYSWVGEPDRSLLPQIFSIDYFRHWANSDIALCLESPSQSLDFGEVVAGKAAEKEFVLRNHSSTPVTLSSVKACCGAEVKISSMVIPPSESATLFVSLKPRTPGRFSKHVRIKCADQEGTELIIPITGAAAGWGGAQFISRFTLPTVILAGLADGFNPCAFSIAIALALVLAAGGRTRSSRLIGGWAFCLGTFLTYMAMGLGLVHLLRMIDGFSLFYDIAMALLSLSLFVLAFLSVRDAYRYRAAKDPSVISLQLPNGVKRLIHKVAEKSWSGPTVAITGLGCGFLVTLLDSLCTGQIYIPVLALVSRETDALRSLALLGAYNLAFIAPLIVIFSLAAKGADSRLLSRWSKRNVFPAKIAMAVVFVILGSLLMPQFGFRAPV